MAMKLGDLSLAQGDGRPPAIAAAGSAPGESGISLFSMRFQSGAHLSGTMRQHLVCFQTSRQVRFDCRIADRSLCHEPTAGSVAICPAGADCSADAADSVDIIAVTIDPNRFALTAAEDLALDARLVERFSGRDQALLELAHVLATEGADGYPNGPLFWNDVASAFLANLVARHASMPEGKARGMLGKDVLERIRNYVTVHLDKPIEVKALAAIAGRSAFHFSRLFARSVGMTPHRYVVHLRLQRAIELIRMGEASLAEAAARTGFADQSHLSRWVRRVYGVSLSQLAA